MDKLAELEKELLEEMEAKPEAYEVQEQTVCVIDNNLRTINIPPDLKNLGVESDDDVHRIFFQMPKSYGEFDLAEFDIRINYKNGNIGDVYAVEDKAAETDVLTFSWLVGRNAVKTKGQTQFIVCLKKTDVSGNVIQELNTTVASLNVLEGLETTEKVVQENPDVIEQILKRLDGVTEIPQEQIQEAVEVYLLEHPIQETDPTVPEWAKQPQKPSYTAEEVGARPNTWTPTAKDVGALPKDTEIPTIPEALPNPNKLTFSGAITAEYDGSGAVMVTIPDTQTERIEKLPADTIVELQPNKLYIFPEMASLTYTLASAEKKHAAEYHFVFKSGTVPTEIVHPKGISVGNFSVDANKIYEVSVMENLLTSQNWEAVT